MSFSSKLLALFLVLLAGPALAQQPVHVMDNPLPVSAASLPLPTGAATETTLGTRLADATLTGRLPAAFASADALAAQTATFMHGGLMGWNGTGWDRLQVDASKNLKVILQNASLAVTGTFWQATQPVSGTFWQTTQPVSIATMPTTPVTGTFWQATQPVSGTVTANQGGAWASSILDGVGGVNKAQVNASNQLSVVCANCSGSGVSQVDNTGFTYGTTVFVPIGGVYNSVITNLTSGDAGAAALTADRNLFVNLNKVGGVALAFGQAVMASSLPVTIASNQSAIPVSGTFWQATQPISAASLPLPTGASTAAKQPALGTAGAASTDVITVQGIASMTPVKVDGSGVTQPVSGTFWQATQPVSMATAPALVASSAIIGKVGIDQTTPGTTNGVQVNASLPAGTNSIGTVQPGNTANTTPWLTTDSATSATASAVPSKAGYVGGNGSGNLTGMTVCDNWTPINQTTGTQLFAGTASKKTYICAIHLVTAITQNIALVGGTGTVCATSPHAIAGGTTAATGWNFGANGGIVMGHGIGVIMQAGTAADNICLLQSGSGQISGTIAWTQY